MIKKIKVLLVFWGLILALSSFSLGVTSQVGIRATVLNAVSFSISTPSSPIDFGGVPPQKVMFPSPIVVNMSSNSSPWVVRVYTTNGGLFTGKGSPAGLIGMKDKSQKVPLKVWCGNYGPALTPPPVEVDTYWKENWLPVTDYQDMSSDPYSWRRLAWVNSTDGDASLGNSFNVYLAADFSGAPSQAYSGQLVFELINQ